MSRRFRLLALGLALMIAGVLIAWRVQISGGSEVRDIRYRRTGRYTPGALICGALLTWYIVAGTATHVA